MFQSLFVCFLGAGVRSQYGLPLTRTLPRDLWLALGCFENWLLSIEIAEYRNLTAEQCIDVLGEHWIPDKRDLVVERYEGDSLMALSTTPIVACCTTERTTSSKTCRFIPERGRRELDDGSNARSPAA